MTDICNIPQTPQRPLLFITLGLALGLVLGLAPGFLASGADILNPARDTAATVEIPLASEDWHGNVRRSAPSE